MATIAQNELLMTDEDVIQETISPAGLSPAVRHILRGMGRLSTEQSVEESSNIGTGSLEALDDTDRNSSVPMAPRLEAILPNTAVQAAASEIQSFETATPAPETSETATIIDAEEIGPRGLAKYLRRAKQSIPAAASALAKTSKDLLTSKEHKTERRAAAAIGSLAVGYMVHKGIIPTPDVFAGHSHEAAPVPRPHSAAPELAPSLHALTTQLHYHAQPVIEHTAKVVEKVKHYKETINYHGDSIWNHVRYDLRAKLGHNPSDSLVQKVTGRVLRANHMSWADARHMLNGRSFNMLSSLRQK
jgi:hypothetical protein